MHSGVVLSTVFKAGYILASFAQSLCSKCSLWQAKHSANVFPASMGCTDSADKGIAFSSWGGGESQLGEDHDYSE